MPLKAHIIGQDEAVHAVAGAIKRACADLSGRHRPASFIFVGPTGVGKTELVKQLANQLFDYHGPAHLDRHERIYGKICGVPSDRLALRAMSATMRPGS